MVFSSFSSSPGCQMRLVCLTSLLCRSFIACPTRKVMMRLTMNSAHGFSLRDKRNDQANCSFTLLNLLKGLHDPNPINVKAKAGKHKLIVNKTDSS